jgi:hypothetical protein
VTRAALVIDDDAEYQQVVTELIDRGVRQFDELPP